MSIISTDVSRSSIFVLPEVISLMQVLLGPQVPKIFPEEDHSYIQHCFFMVKAVFDDYFISQTIMLDVVLDHVNK